MVITEPRCCFRVAHQKKNREPKRIAGARKRGECWHLDKKIDGVRYREPLNTRDWREAAEKVTERIAGIKAAKAASPAGKTFARLPFQHAVEVWKNERIGTDVRA